MAPEAATAAAALTVAAASRADAVAVGEAGRAAGREALPARTGA